MKRGDNKTFQSKRLSNLTCTVWKDTSIVWFASCLSKPTVSSHVHRRVGRHLVEVPVPGVAVTYGKYMGGVDKFDAMMMKKLYAKLGHASCKVWRHLLWYLVNMAISNAWILYKLTSTRQQPKNFDHMAFRLELAKHLIGGFIARKKLLSPKMNVGEIIENMSNHQLTHNKGKRPWQCVPHKTYKPNNKPKKETVYSCVQCQQQMCQDCFRIVHLLK